jgi:hypothetical protein
MCCFEGENEEGDLVAMLTMDVVTDSLIEATVGPSGMLGCSQDEDRQCTSEQLDNGSLRLDDGAQINLGNGPELNPTNAMTLCLWVNLLEDHPGTWHLLATKWNDAADPNDKYLFHFGLQDSTINLLMSEDGETFQTLAEGGTLLAEHGAVHACFTAEAPGSATIYMNGVPTGQPGSYNAQGFPQISQPLIIGCKANGYPTCGDFVVDEFMFWDRALSATEIYRAVYLETYDPGWGALSVDVAQDKCEWDDFYVRAQQVTEKCCGADGGACDAAGLPATCNLECATTFVPFYDECQGMLVELLEDSMDDFDTVAEQCVEQDSTTLFDALLGLRARGCFFPLSDDLTMASGRRLQGLNFGGLGGGDACPFTDFDVRVVRITISLLYCPADVDTTGLLSVFESVCRTALELSTRRAARKTMVTLMVTRPALRSRQTTEFLIPAQSCVPLSLSHFGQTAAH